MSGWLLSFRGVLAVLLAVITPLLPVRQDRGDAGLAAAAVGGRECPLVSYTPLELHLSLPCTVLRELPSGTVLSTVPVDASKATAKGLLVRVSDEPGAGRTLSVLQREIPVLSAPSPRSPDVGVHSRIHCRRDDRHPDRRCTAKTARPFTNTVAGDVRPQVVGVFTDLTRAQLGDRAPCTPISTRGSSSSPTALKTAATVGAVAVHPHRAAHCI